MTELPDAGYDPVTLRRTASRASVGLDDLSMQVVASADPLVIVEGAAGSGKTTMLITAIASVNERDGVVRVVAPTKKAADIAHQALGVSADSVATLVHAHGYRWNSDGIWTRLRPDDIGPETGRAYNDLPEAARLGEGQRIVVDEAGMLDQDSALALFTVAAEHGATLVLIGDRAQLPAARSAHSGLSRDGPSIGR